MKKRKTDDNDPIIILKPKVKFAIYIELFLLLFFCNSNNYIIKAKEDEIIKNLDILKDDATIFSILLQCGRLVGVIFIAVYFFCSKRLEHIQYFIFISILLKGLTFLVYCRDLNKEFVALFELSIFSQGLFHSFIDLYFPIWINHFIDEDYKLLFLSISNGASPLSYIFGIIFFTYISESIKYCFITLIIFIFIIDFIFLLTVTNNSCFNCDDISLDNYFNPLVSQNENTNEYSINDNKNENLEKIKKNNYKLIFCFENTCAFISIVLSRAILKFSFVGINYLINDYYDNELSGDGKLNQSLIFYVPLIGLFIGAILSYFKWFRKNITTLIISIFIGIFGTLTSLFNNKLIFIVFIIFFYGTTNLIIPSLIQKSFDCFDDKQVSEISYAFNCFFIC